MWVNGDKEVKLGSPKFNYLAPQWRAVSEGLRRGDYRLLVDFDAHFEEIELDFRNSFVS